MKTVKEFKEYVKPNGKVISQRMLANVLEKQGFMSLINSLYDDTYTLKEKTFCMLNDITERPKCKTCGNTLPFNNSAVKYPNYCSRKCSNADPTVLAKNKVGVSKALKKAYEERGETIKEKRSSTLKEKYNLDEDVNVTSPFSLKEVRDKCVDTMIERYGVNNAYKLDKCMHNARLMERERSVENYKRLGYNVEYIDFHMLKVYNECPKHPEYIISIYNMNNRALKERKGIICPICNPISSFSSLELIIKEYLDELGITYLTNDRKVISPMELDIYLPQYNLAIELNGMYWHNEYNKPKDYHQKKWQKCKDADVRLLQFWEDDIYNNLDIIKSMIKSKLSLNSDYNIGARKCEICYLNNDEYKEFINNNHIQGHVSASIKLGLKYNNEIVSVLSLGKLRTNLGYKSSENSYELYRYANKKYTNVQGGFSKLLSYFEKEYNPKFLLSYASLDYSNGNVYERNGFILDKITSIGYTWCNGDKRYNRYNFRRSELNESDTSKTEVDIMHERGYYRCYDAGNLKYVKIYNN